MIKTIDMENKNLINLGDCSTTIKGYAFKSQWYSSEGRPLVKVSNFSDNSIDTSNLVFIPEKIAKEYEKYSLMRDDVIIQTVGSYASNPASVVGKVIRVPFSASGYLLNQNAVKIIPNSEIEKKFLYYLLKNDTFKNYILGTARGAANQASITLESIIHFKFYLPPFPTQQKIATLISAYDNLIENNSQRIKILEEITHAIYREWFVNLHFPGHESVRMVESELGLVPEGWEVKKVKNLVKRLTAGEVYTQLDVTADGQVPVIDQSRDEILGYHNNNADHKASADSPIIIFGDHTCKMQLLIEPFSVGPNVIPFISANNFPLLYLYFLIHDLVKTKEYKRHWTELSNKVIVIAPVKQAQFFSDIVESYFENMRLLRLKNTNLRRTRDLLLPKLISGELDVSGLDIDIPADL